MFYNIVSCFDASFSKAKSIISTSKIEFNISNFAEFRRHHKLLIEVICLKLHENLNNCEIMTLINKQSDC